MTRKIVILLGDKGKAMMKRRFLLPAVVLLAGMVTAVWLAAEHFTYQDGDGLASSQLLMLRQLGLLDDDEQVLLYPPTLFGCTWGANDSFLTTKRLAYFSLFYNDKHIHYAAWTEIANMQLVRRESSDAADRIDITRTDGERQTYWLPYGTGEAERFYQRMRQEWQARRGRPVAIRSLPLSGEELQQYPVPQDPARHCADQYGSGIAVSVGCLLLCGMLLYMWLCINWMRHGRRTARTVWQCLLPYWITNAVIAALYMPASVVLILFLIGVGPVQFLGMALLIAMCMFVHGFVLIAVWPWWLLLRRLRGGNRAIGQC